MTYRGLKRTVVGAVAAGFLLVAPSGETTCAMAQSSTCRTVCLDRYNQCRIANKGAPACDAQYQTCLQGCLSGR